MRKRPEPVTVDLNRRACFVSRPERGWSTVHAILGRKKVGEVQYSHDQ